MTEQENHLITQAKRALREGDKAKARQLAEESSLKFPDDLEAWLILAGLSSSQRRLDYLLKAQQLAPDDKRVQEATQWVSAQEEINTSSSIIEEDNRLEASRSPQPIEDSQVFPASICPFLGIINDPRSSVAYSSKKNICYRVKPIESPKLAHQSAYCLAQRYEHCKVFKSPPDKKMPKDMRLKSQRSADLRKLIFWAFLIGFLLTALVWGFYYRDEVIADFSRLVDELRSQLAPTEGPQQQIIQATITQTLTLTPSPTMTASATQLPTATRTPRPPTHTSPPPTSTREKPSLALETPIGTEIQFIIHKVIPGESLELYARDYETSVTAIRAVNYRLPSFLPLNWVVVIPLETEDVQNLPPFEPYEVKDEMSVKNLSAQLGVNLRDMSFYNNLEANMLLLPGDWLLIPREPKQ